MICFQLEAPEFILRVNATNVLRHCTVGHRHYFVSDEIADIDGVKFDDLFFRKKSTSFFRKKMVHMTP